MKPDPVLLLRSASEHVRLAAREAEDAAQVVDRAAKELLEAQGAPDPRADGKQRQWSQRR